MEAIIIRHGQTPGNAARRYVGCAEDQPLSDKGREQARAARVDEAVPRVYVSTMLRARQTAEIMFPQADIVAWKGLQEMDFGVFTGRTPDEMVDDAQYRAWVDSGCLDRCPGGESKEDYSARTCEAFTALVRACADQGEERIWLVAHGGTQMSLLDRYADDDRAYWEWLRGNCEGYRVDLELEDDALRFVHVEPWPREDDE